MEVVMQLHDGLVREFNLLKDYCSQNGHAFRSVMGLKAARRGTLGEHDLAHGTVEFMTEVFNKQIKRVPSWDCYPHEIKSCLLREVWVTTLASVGEGFEGFIKPMRTKLWTGFVVRDPGDMQKLAVFSKSTPVYLSETVEWKSEWRYYVIKGEIRASACYEGDDAIEPDLFVVNSALKLIKDRAAAFCIDFGVLADGRTALVEVNDGWSLGWYLDNQVDVYFELLMTRYREIVES